MENFKIKFKNLRIENGLSQHEIASLLGVSQDIISLWELGKRYPSLKVLIKISKYFEVTTDYLLGL